jgi:glycosyltransferase involved in cell wall biosynthesis
MINSISKGGSERQMLELIKGLTRSSDSGFEIFLISMKNKIEYDYVYNLPIRFEIIEKRGTKNFNYVLRLRKIIKEFKPDIIHSWDITASVYLSVAKLFLKQKLINGFIVNAYDGLGWKDSRYLRVKLLTPFCNRIVANSKAGLRAYDITSSKATCIYPGIDFSRFDDLKKSDKVALELLGTKKENHFIATMVASFDHRKDYDTLVEAAIKMCTDNSEIFFLLIGDGPERERLQNLVIAKDLAKQIFFLGKRNDVEAILQITDVGLLITPSEGISTSIMEYMAMGKPVIATDGGGNKELVIDGENGFLIPQKSPDVIIDRLQKLIKDKKLCGTMGSWGYSWVREKFSLTNMTNSYIQLYRQLFEQNS